MRKTGEEIKELFDKIKNSVVVGGFYAHYSHPGEKRYRVVAIGLMEDTWVPMVTYEDLVTGSCTIHTLDNFLKKMEVDGKMVDRFTLVG